MKKFDSVLFGTIPQPTSFQEIAELSLNPAPDEDRAVRMWRGQSDIDWPLHSTAYRRLCSRKDHVSGGKMPNERDLCFYEKSLLKAADHKGYRFYEGRRLPDFELLARLRHHGAATRLVDATRNMLVALWFCVESNPAKVGLLIGIHAHYVGGYEGETKEGDYEAVTEVLSKYQHPMTWEPSPNSPRVAAQHSQFLYSALCKEKTGSLVLPKQKDCVLAMAITPEVKTQASRVLSEVFDIRRATLFPDFDGFSFSRGPQCHPDEDHRW
jgi:hypothetical protein